MVPVSTPVQSRTALGKQRGVLRRGFEWLFSPELFQIKLLVGTAVGALVIVVLAVTCIVVTLRTQKRAELRAHTIEVMRLSNVVENDLSALENAYRGHLLTRTGTYLESSAQFQELLLKHSEEHTSVLADNSQQRIRVLKMREIVLNCLKQRLLSTSRFQNQDEQSATQVLINAQPLDSARVILQAIQREELIELNHMVREQEWAAQSTQVLNFTPKMERAASDIQKEGRGYILTGDRAFIESYKRALSDFYTYQGYLSVLMASEPAAVRQIKLIREHIETWLAEYGNADIEAKRSGQEISNSRASRVSRRRHRARLQQSPHVGRRQDFSRRHAAPT